MNGNLEPDERVLDDSLIYPGGMLGQLAIVLEKLGWEYGDEVDVEIGGTSVSGIDVGEVYNKKWQSPIGTRKYNKDAFIIIKNQSRRDLTKSQPNPELIGHHAKETRRGDQEDNGSNSVEEPEVSA
jgi:hypothetical protein